LRWRGRRIDDKIEKKSEDDALGTWLEGKGASQASRQSEKQWRGRLGRGKENNFEEKKGSVVLLHRLFVLRKDRLDTAFAHPRSRLRGKKRGKKV